MKQEERKKLLDDFKKKYSDPQTLELNTYTGLGEEREDFTYWIEWKLDCFGGIKGGSSYKFGIYRCNEEPEKNFDKDGDVIYAWAEKYTKEKKNTKQDAFNEIKTRICSVVKAVQDDNVNYEAIEQIDLGDAYKWKIAFLYSQNRLVPVYKKDVLITAARRLGVCPNTDITIAQMQKVLMEYYNKHKKDFHEDICDFGGYVWEKGNTNISQSNQIIKYGAPGTGKTFTAKTEAEEFFEIWKLDRQVSSIEFNNHYEFVQFHPSYSYEDFIEGIKPVINKDGNTELKLTNGIFKSFCKKAAQYELWLLNNNILHSGQKLSDIKINDINGEQLQQNNSPFAFLENVDGDTPISHYIPPYFFVIDEINRADLSRVFGELMYCLEYRGFEGRIKTQYSELEKDDTIFYEENNQHYFFIPNNVYIIGTMNTIDRSVESFDFALRRRFLWQRVDPNEKVLNEYFGKQKESKIGRYIIPGWNNLNKRIAQDLGPDYQIGHSYLMKLDKYRNFTPSSYRNIIWENHIKPILEEYFRGTGREATKQIEEFEKQFKSKSDNNG